MEELLEKFKTYILKKGKPRITAVMRDLDIQEYEVYGLIELLKQQGYLFEIIDGKIAKSKPIKENEIYTIPNNLEHIKLLLISDTHLASKYDRLDILRYLYNQAEQKQINYVLHSGDVTDGRSNRDEQIYDLRETSYTGQRDYVIDKYPHSEIPTYMIAGNHDLWWVDVYMDNKGNPKKITQELETFEKIHKR